MLHHLGHQLFEKTHLHNETMGGKTFGRQDIRVTARVATGRVGDNYWNVFVPAPVCMLTDSPVWNGRWPSAAGQPGVKFHQLGDLVLRSGPSRNSMVSHDDGRRRSARCRTLAFWCWICWFFNRLVIPPKCPEILPKTVQCTPRRWWVGSVVTAVEVEYWWP